MGDLLFRRSSRIREKKESEEMADKGKTLKRANDSVSASGSTPKIPKLNICTRIDKFGIYRDGEMKYSYPSDDNKLLAAIELQKGRFCIYN